MNKQKKLILTVVMVSLVLASAAFWVHYQSTHKALPARGVPSVTVTRVAEQEWQESVKATGVLIANQGIVVKADTSGKITQLNFKSGQWVKKGDVLVIQDNLIQEGSLQYAKAQHELSKLTYSRNLRVFEKGAISAEEKDNAEVDVALNSATVTQKQGEYDKTIITAPFDGRLGLRNVSLGDYLDAGDEIVNLQNNDPLYVDFSVPEKYLQAIVPNLKVEIQPDSMDETTYEGAVTSIDSLIDSSTGTLSVRAKLNNDDYKLLPGGFVEVTVYFGHPKTVLTIPQTSIVYDESGDYVYRVMDGKVSKQSITIGKQIGQAIIVTSGLSEGDDVVSAGTNKVSDGIPVNIDNNQTSQ